MTAYRHDGTEQVLTYDPTHLTLLGYQHTASGYGKKLPTRWVTTNANGRRVRVYATCYSNAASTWFLENGGQVFIN